MLATHLLEPSFDGEERGVSRGAAIATDSASSRGAVGDVAIQWALHPLPRCKVAWRQFKNWIAALRSQ